MIFNFKTKKIFLFALKKKQNDWNNMLSYLKMTYVFFEKNILKDMNEIKAQF